MPVRAATSDVLARVRTELTTQAQSAAGNALLSRDEQARLPPGDLLREAADAVRADGGAGARVAVDALVDNAAGRAAQLLGQVNQPSGPGAATVSQDEVRQLARLHADVAARVARAYESITGRRIELGAAGPTPPPTPPPATPPTTPAPVALLGAQLLSGTPAGPPLQLSTTPTGALVIDGRIGLPAQLSLQLSSASAAAGAGARALLVDLPAGLRSTSTATNMADERDIIEAIRRAAAPAHDVRVTRFSGGQAEIELWPAGTAPPQPAPGQAGPVYVAATYTTPPPATHNLHSAGATAFKGSNDGPLPAGVGVRLRVDNRLYVSLSNGQRTLVDLARDLKAQLEGAGQRVELRDYAPGLNLFQMRVLP